jgi:hypothetical protein
MKAMKTTIGILAVILVVCAVSYGVDRFELPIAKVTVKVVDEDRLPIMNAHVTLVFENTSVDGVTDDNGLFAGEGPCNISGIGSRITKEGYYLGSAPLPKFKDLDEVANKWKPWNKTYEVILRPIRNPVPLFARKVDSLVPVLGQPCGFDLEAGDWVAPYGKGLNKDFIFTVQENWRGSYDYDVEGELTFKNALDGIQQASEPDVASNSVFTWQREAPENGYEPRQMLRNVRFPDGSGKASVRSFTNEDVWSGLFFRVRTVEQNGGIMSARYGKIRGGIAIYPNKSKPRIVFTYYFNPKALARNLEWDTRQDLFLGLRFMELPRMP